MPWALSFSISDSVHRRKQIYHIATLDPPSQEDGTQLFATVGANRVSLVCLERSLMALQASVYELSVDGEISLLTMFVDSDTNEVYYVAAWGRPETLAPEEDQG